MINKEGEECIMVPIWILEQINDTLRMTANSYDCKKRETCWQRNIMESYNMTDQILKTGEYEYKIEHYLGYNQEP